MPPWTGSEDDGSWKGIGEVRQEELDVLGGGPDRYILGEHGFEADVRARGPPLPGRNEGDETSCEALSIAAMEGNLGRVALLLPSVNIVALFLAAGDVFSDPGSLDGMPLFMSGVDMSGLQREAAIYGVEYDSVVVGLKGLEASLSGEFDQLFLGRKSACGGPECWTLV